MEWGLGEGGVWRLGEGGVGARGGWSLGARGGWSLGARGGWSLGARGHCTSCHTNGNRSYHGNTEVMLYDGCGHMKAVMHQNTYRMF